MTLHKCIYCLYSTERKASFDIHLNSLKHKKNYLSTFNKFENKNNNIENLIIQVKEEFKEQNVEVLKQNEELKQKIEHLEKVNNQNTNKIVREAREVKKSILTVLNTKFKDTPALDYIKEDQFINGLQLEYKCKLVPDD
jgi:predicted RND superfamily exporter protein